MTHIPTRSRRDVLHRSALAGLLGAVLLPGPVGAQIPNVRRRAQDAAVRAAGVDTQPNPCRRTVVFDSVMLELTSPRLEQVLKGLRARRQVLNGRRGAPSWNAMVTQRDAAANAAADLLDRKGPEMDAYRERLNRITQCRDSAFSEKRQAKREASMQRTMTDPDFMRQTTELAVRVAEAQQKGDTAEMMRLNGQLVALLEGGTREDTLAVDRHCGRLPAPPASLTQLDSLQALQDTLNAQLQRREQEAASVAIGASGLTAQQMAMGQERAEMFLAQAAAEGALCGFSPAERAALKAEQAELDELL